MDFPLRVCVCVCVRLHIKVITVGGTDLHWFDMQSIFPSLSFHLLSALPLSFHFLSSHLLSCHLFLRLSLSLSLSLCLSRSLPRSAFLWLSQSSLLGPKKPLLNYIKGVTIYAMPLVSVYLCLNSLAPDHVHTNPGVETLSFFFSISSTLCLALPFVTSQQFPLLKIGFRKRLS